MVANSAAAAADNYNTGGFRIPPLPSAGVETLPVETKPVETKPVETKPVETKPYLNKYNTLEIPPRSLIESWDDSYTSTGFQQVSTAPHGASPAVIAPPRHFQGQGHMLDADSADEFADCNESEEAAEAP